MFFKNFTYKTYGLDPRYSYTLPRFSWQAILKMTNIELDLISDQDMYLFLMDSIRGGICQVKKNIQKLIINILEFNVMNGMIKKLRKN